MDDLLSVAIYGYCGAERARNVLWTVRQLGGDALPVFVAQDFDGNATTAAAYDSVCREFDAEHVRLTKHVHMSGCCHAAVEATNTPWILLCSEDILLPKRFVPMLLKFLEDNTGKAFCSRIAGAYLTHYDSPDIDALIDAKRIALPSTFRTRRDFYSVVPGNEQWWWSRIDFELPQQPWSEATPDGLVSCCSNVHGAAFLVNRRYWDQIGGTHTPVRENDSVFSFRIGHWTDGVIVRIPSLPTLAHQGAASPNPPDHEQWAHTVGRLAIEHGGMYDDKIKTTLATACPQDCLADIERGLKLRAYSLQVRYDREIRNLNYSYKTIS